MAVTLPDLFKAEKTLSGFMGWNRSKAEPDTGGIWFDANLEIGGFVEAGLTLHGQANRFHPDRHVGLELVFKVPGTKRRFALGRLDWRSLKGGHTNKRRAGWPLAGKRVSATHYHAFELNWDDTTQRLRSGDLPQAMEIDGQIQSFEAMRAMAGMLFRINNIDLVSIPPWEYDLFPNG